MVTVIRSSGAYPRARERQWNRVLLNEADWEMHDGFNDYWADELLESEHYQATVFPGQWPRTDEQRDAAWQAYLALPP